MSWAEIISFDEVRARQQWDTLCQQLQTRFHQWLDILGGALTEACSRFGRGDYNCLGVASAAHEWRERDDYPTCLPRRSVSPAYLLSHM